MTLRQVLDAHRVLVCVGSGGVGKTTTSASLALQAATEGRHVLCLTIDPARRLANSLGLKRFDEQERQIGAERFEAAGLSCRGSLTIMMLDMKRTFDDLVTKHARSPESRQRILDNRIYQYVSTSLAGTQEYMAMEKLYQVRQDDRFDLIVLDTPPTTNALDFLDAPEKLVGIIDSPVMRFFVEALEGSGAGVVGKGTSLALRGLSKFTGVEFLHHIGDFVSGLNELFGGFRQRANSVSQALRADDVAFVVVTSPSPPTVGEAIFFLRKLADYDVEARGLVVNRVHSALPESSLNDEELERALRGRLSEVPPPELLRKMRRALAEHRIIADADREGIRRLREHLGDTTAYSEIPAFDGGVCDLPALAAVAQHLMGEPALGAQPASEEVSGA